MLTLQMIRLMENLWKKEGLDLRYSRGSTLPLRWRSCASTQRLFLSPYAQDDTVRLPVYREQDGAHRGREELRHHRKYPAQQQQQRRHRSLQQGRSAQLAQIQESWVSVSELCPAGTMQSSHIHVSKRWWKRHVQYVWIDKGKKAAHGCQFSDPLTEQTTVKSQAAAFTAT